MCRAGNRESLWTHRHDTLQRMLMFLMRSVQTPVREVGRTRLFGAAGATPGGGYLFADLYSRDYRAVGRHLYIDVAIVDPTGKSALDASPSSAVEVGAAAKAKVGIKWGRYRGAVEAVSGVFRAAVVERFGAMSCEMQGLLRMMAGDADRDLRAADDWSFAAQSRRAYFEQHAVFAAVMADAAMLDAVIGVDGEYGDVRDGGAGG